jgi:hypothetical protein
VPQDFSVYAVARLLPQQDRTITRGAFDEPLGSAATDRHWHGRACSLGGARARTVSQILRRDYRLLRRTKASIRRLPWRNRINHVMSLMANQELKWYYN